MLKYIFFDIGYTLVNEDRVWEQRCKEQAQTAEAKALGLTPERIYQEIVQASLQCLPQYRTVIEKFHLHEAAPYRHELESLYADAPEVLAALSKRYSLGIIANQSEGLLERLRQWGIAQYFSVVVSSWDCRAAKPDPRIFEFALERANCRPQEAMMVGDRLDNDIRPAKALGYQAAWIKNGFGGMQVPSSQDQKADLEIRTLTQLLEILA